jgi:hypothetical protein
MQPFAKHGRQLINAEAEIMFSTEELGPVQAPFSFIGSTPFWFGEKRVTTKKISMIPCLGRICSFHFAPFVFVTQSRLARIKFLYLSDCHSKLLKRIGHRTNCMLPVGTIPIRVFKQLLKSFRLKISFFKSDPGCAAAIVALDRSASCRKSTGFPSNFGINSILGATGCTIGEGSSVLPRLLWPGTGPLGVFPSLEYMGAAGRVTASGFWPLLFP